MTIIVRREAPEDRSAIHAITNAAFSNSTTESAIINSLRAADALTLSLVAVDCTPQTPGEIVGHVAFSPVTISPKAEKVWLGLGPICVAPDRRRRGIARQLIEEGLETVARTDGVQGCVLLGDPKFYGRFGFVAGQGLRLEGVPAEYFMSRVLDGGACPAGEVRFHRAFDQSLTDVDSKTH